MAIIKKLAVGFATSYLAVATAFGSGDPKKVDSEVCVFDMPQRPVVDRKVYVESVGLEDKLSEISPLVSLSSGPGLEYVSSVVSIESSVEKSVSHEGIEVDVPRLEVRSVGGDNGELSWGLCDDDMKYVSEDGERSFGVLEYVKGFAVDLSKSRLTGEVKRIWNGGSVWDTEVSGVKLKDVYGALKRMDEFAEVKVGDDGFLYSIDRSASVSGDAKVNVENEFVSEGGDKVRVRSGVAGFVNASAEFGLNLGVKWKAGSLEELAGEVSADARMKYSYDIENGMFVEVSEESKDGDSIRVGIIVKDIESERFSEEYSAFVDASVEGLGASAGYSVKESRKKIEREESVVYVGFSTKEDDSFVAGNVGIKDSHIDFKRKSSLKGKRFVIGLNGFEKENFAYDLKEKGSEDSVDLAYGVAGSREVLQGSDLGVCLFGWADNYPDNDMGIGGSVDSEFLSGKIDSRGDYLAAVKLFGKGGSFEKDFEKMLEDKINFAEDYLVEYDSFIGKDGGYIFGKKVGDLEKAGLVFVRGKYLAEGGVVKKRDMDGFYGKVGIGGLGLRVSCMESDDGLSERLECGVDYKVRKNVSIGAKGKFGDDKMFGIFFKLF